MLSYPPSSDEYTLAKRIFPVQKHYVERLFPYFYLTDTDLIGHLTPSLQVPISINYPDYNKWKVLYNRLWIIYNKEVIHVLSNAVSSFNLANFELNNPFIFE